MRKQFLEPFDGVHRNPREDIAKPGKRLNTAPFAGGDETAQYRCRFSAFVAAEEMSRCRDQSPSRIHSAHIGQEVDVHYRWHPLYGRRLRVEHIEQRASGRVIYVEVTPGTVMILQAW